MNLWWYRWVEVTNFNQIWSALQSEIDRYRRDKSPEALRGFIESYKDLIEGTTARRVELGYAFELRAFGVIVNGSNIDQVIDNLTKKVKN